MIKDIIYKAKIQIFSKGKEVELPDVKNALPSLFDGAYSSHSYINGLDLNEETILAQNACVVLTFSHIVMYKEHRFEKIIFELKPKYDFLTLVPFLDGKILEKCINVNLATSTTPYYKAIVKK